MDINEYVFTNRTALLHHLTTDYVRLDTTNTACVFFFVWCNVCHMKIYRHMNIQTFPVAYLHFAFFSFSISMLTSVLLVFFYYPLFVVLILIVLLPCSFPTTTLLTHSVCWIQ
jgi:hypothetical protein